MNCRSVFFLLPTVNLIRKGTIKKENIPKKQEWSKNFIAFSGAGIYIYILYYNVPREIFFETEPSISDIRYLVTHCSCAVLQFNEQNRQKQSKQVPGDYCHPCHII